MKVPELQRILIAAARQEEMLVDPARDSRSARTTIRRHWSRLRGSRWRALSVVALLLLGGTAVGLASGLIPFGAPATSVPVFANPRVGLGRIAPGAVHLLPLSVADPHGGLPWGMRVLRTTRGAGCLQVGRLLDGRVVALGQDGAFANDGRAHELPLSTNIERLNCALLDGRGRIFTSVTLKSEAASAAQGAYCRPPGTYAPSRGAAPPTCPLADERNLYYGMLGPDASSVTYSTGGKTHTVATTGSEGAYLIVTTGTTHLFSGRRGRLDRAGLATSDDVPVFSPITAIHYGGGATCDLVTAERWIYGPRACSPYLAEPFGYTPTRTPTRAQLATPIHVRLLRDAHGRWEIHVRFTSRVAISSLRGEYELHWRAPGTPTEGEASQSIDQGASASSSGMIPQNENVAPGQRLTTTIDQLPFGPGLNPGVLRGSVILRYSDGTLIEAEEDTVKIPVGSFSVRIPPPRSSRRSPGSAVRESSARHPR
jgi:hypothetical protein